ncbi:MAG: hypothetical protein ACK4FE_10115 [Azonexus sp.]
MSAQALQEFFVSLGFEVDTAKINEFEQQTARLRDEMLKIGAVVTGVAGGIGMFVTAVAQGIDELGDFAEMENVSIAALQEIGHAAQLNGSSLEAVKASVSGVNKTVGEAALGIGRGAQTLEKLGMSAKNADGSIKSFDQVLEEVAGKMEGLSRQEQIALAEKLGIDRSLIPLLAKGRGELEALREEARAFGIASEEDAAKAGALTDALDRTKFMLGALGKQIAVGFMPQVTAVLDGFRGWLVANRKIINSGVGGALKTVTAIIGTLWDWTVRLADGAVRLVKRLSDFKVVTWAAGAAVAALIAYQAGAFFTTLGGAVMTAARALFTFNASAALPVILVGGLVIVIGLLVDELVNFYEGNETVIGQLNEKYPGAIYAAWAALMALGGGFIALKWKAIASMVETMAIMAMYAAQWITAHAAMAAGALVAYWPILLIIGAIAAVVGGVWYLWENWETVTKLLGDAWKVVTDTVGEAFAGAMGIIDQVKAKVMGFIETITGAIGKVGEFLGLTDGSSSVKVAMQSAGAPAAGGVSALTGASGGVIGSSTSLSSTNTTSTQTVTIGAPQITINNPDPAAAAREVRREFERMNRQVIRNGQSAVVQ